MCGHRQFRTVATSSPSGLLCDSRAAQAGAGSGGGRSFAISRKISAKEIFGRETSAKFESKRRPLGVMSWSGTAIANTELVLRVVAYDPTGKEVPRVTIAGSGYGELDGGYDAGAKALETATNQAIIRTMENYVSRVINAQQI